MNKKTFIPASYRPKVKGQELLTDAIPGGVLEVSLGDFKNKTKISSIVCIYVGDDDSQTKVIKKYHTESNVIFLTYDQLGDTWNFVFFKKELIFLVNHILVRPIGIYFRPYCPMPSHPKFELCDNLLKAVDSWNGLKIGANSEHFHNSSKGYQLFNTILKCTNGNNKFKIPKTYFVKGINSYRKIEDIMNHLVVKSASGIRSEVATVDKFSCWDLKNISNQPVLFQEKCLGPDIRAHWMEDNCWQVIIEEKRGSIDFRYASWKSPFKKYGTDLDITDFCKKLAKKENLKLIGVDFIKCNNTYYCLESNPNPGWAGFHRHSGCEIDLVKSLLEKIGGT